MVNDKYLPRISDRQLALLLEATGAVLIEGAKWCGKTSSARQYANSVLYMQDPDNRNAYMKTAEMKPSLLLEGNTPRLLDEWQDAPVLWDAVRHQVDMRQKSGQFILTGSAVPTDEEIHHSGAGRISRMRMRPMSLFESLESNGSVSLSSLFDGETDVAGISNISIDHMAYLICRGGWPASVGKSEQASLITAHSYVDAIINKDTHRVDGVEKNPDRVRLLLRSLSRNITTLATAQTIIGDVAANEMSITDKTYTSYINALRRIFVVEDLPAWQPSLRSKTAIRTTEKRHFVDPSIATSVLKVKPNILLKDFEYFGFLFEALCTRDIRVYADACDGKVYHYRDKNGLEADMIIQLADGRWAPVEVKMGSKQIDEAAAHLRKLREKVNTDKMGEPSFLMVLTAGEFAYRRDDGVVVVPLGCLKD
ncbi:MAG: ATP-binding protein [Prevotella sp.]